MCKTTILHVFVFHSTACTSKKSCRAFLSIVQDKTHKKLFHIIIKMTLANLNLSLWYAFQLTDEYSHSAYPYSPTLSPVHGCNRPVSAGICSLPQAPIFLLCSCFCGTIDESRTPPPGKNQWRSGTHTGQLLSLLLEPV